MEMPALSCVQLDRVEQQIWKAYLKLIRDVYDLYQRNPARREVHRIVRQYVKKAILKIRQEKSEKGYALAKEKPIRPRKTRETERAPVIDLSKVIGTDGTSLIGTPEEAIRAVGALAHKIPEDELIRVFKIIVNRLGKEKSKAIIEEMIQAEEGKKPRRIVIRRLRRLATLKELAEGPQQKSEKQKQPSYLIQYLEREGKPRWSWRAALCFWVVPHELANLLQAAITGRWRDLIFSPWDIFAGLNYENKAPPCVFGTAANIILGIFCLSSPHTLLLAYGIFSLIFVGIEITLFLKANHIEFILLPLPCLPAGSIFFIQQPQYALAAVSSANRVMVLSPTSNIFDNTVVKFAREKQNKGGAGPEQKMMQNLREAIEAKIGRKKGLTDNHLRMLLEKGTLNDTKVRGILETVPLKRGQAGQIARIVNELKYPNAKGKAKAEKTDRKLTLEQAAGYTQQLLDKLASKGNLPGSTLEFEQTDLKYSGDLMRIIMPKDYQKIVVVGSGLLHFPLLLALLGYDVTFIDIEWPCAERMRLHKKELELLSQKKLRLKVIHGEFGKLNLQTQQMQAGIYDLVTLIDLIGTKDAPVRGNPKEWLNQAKRLLNPHKGSILMDEAVYEGMEWILEAFRDMFPEARLAHPSGIRGAFNQTDTNRLYDAGGGSSQFAEAPTKEETDSHSIESIDGNQGIIAPAEPKDASRIYELSHLIKDSPIVGETDTAYYEKAVKVKELPFRNESHIFVYRDEEREVRGYIWAAVNLDKKVVHIVQVAVDKDYQEKGIGTKLHQYLIVEMKKRGFEKFISLSTSPYEDKVLKKLGLGPLERIKDVPIFSMRLSRYKIWSLSVSSEEFSYVMLQQVLMPQDLQIIRDIAIPEILKKWDIEGLSGLVMRIVMLQWLQVSKIFPAEETCKDFTIAATPEMKRFREYLSGKRKDESDEVLISYLIAAANLSYLLDPESKKYARWLRGGERLLSQFDPLTDFVENFVQYVFYGQSFRQRIQQASGSEKERLGAQYEFLKKLCGGKEYGRTDSGFGRESRGINPRMRGFTPILTLSAMALGIVGFAIALYYIGKAIATAVKPARADNNEDTEHIIPPARVTSIELEGFADSLKVEEWGSQRGKRIMVEVSCQGESLVIIEFHIEEGGWFVHFRVARGGLEGKDLNEIMGCLLRERFPGMKVKGFVSDTPETKKLFSRLVEEGFLVSEFIGKAQKGRRFAEGSRPAIALDKGVENSLKLY